MLEQPLAAALKVGLVATAAYVLWRLAGNNLDTRREVSAVSERERFEARRRHGYYGHGG